MFDSNWIGCTAVFDSDVRLHQSDLIEHDWRFDFDIDYTEEGTIEIHFDEVRWSFEIIREQTN